MPWTARSVLGVATESELRQKQQELTDILRRLEYIRLEEPVLEQAAQHLPVVLGALDSVHLASALLYRAAYRPLLFATHDAQLARAARAMHFEVIGA